MIRFLVPLYLPKSAHVRHGRLEKCYNFLLLVQMAWLTAWFISDRKWSTAVVIGREEVGFHIWSQHSTDATELSQECLIDGNELDYLDHIGNYHINFTCRSVCPAGIVAPDCHSMHEVIYVDASRSSITFVTNIEQEMIEFHNSTAQGQSKLQNQSKSSFMVPYIHETAGFSFRYIFHAGKEKRREPENLWTFSEFHTDSIVNAETIVLDHSGAPQRTIPPGEAGIVLFLPELLKLAGLQNFLTKPQASLGANRLPGASHSAGPIGWLTGLKIDLKVSCYDRWSRPRGFNVKSGAKNVCTVQVMARPPQWVTKTTQKRLGDTYLLVHEHGVEVRLRQGGSFRMVSVGTMVNFLAGFIVFMQMPVKVCRAVATACLGALSKVYCSMLNQQLNFREYIAGVAMQIVATNLIFEGLCDSGKCISWKKLSRSLHAAFEDHPQLDKHEINVFIMLSFLLLIDETSDISTQRLTEHDKKGVEAYAQLTSQGVIRREAFMTACAMTNSTRMDEFIRLFDKDRKLACFERMFLPGLMRNVALSFEQHEVLNILHVSDENPELDTASTAEHDSAKVVECEQSVDFASEIMPEPQPVGDTSAKLVDNQVLQDLEKQTEKLMGIQADMESRLDRIETSIGKHKSVEELALLVVEQQQILADLKSDILIRLQRQDECVKELENVLEGQRATIDTFNDQISNQVSFLMAHSKTSSAQEVATTESILDVCTRMTDLDRKVEKRFEALKASLDPSSGNST